MFVGGHWLCNVLGIILTLVYSQTMHQKAVTGQWSDCLFDFSWINGERSTGTIIA